MTDFTGGDISSEVRRPILRFGEQSDLGQLDVHDVGADLLATVKYDIDSSNRLFWMKFNSARAYRFHAEAHCTLYHITDAYEKLIEIDGSRWQTEVKAASKTSMWTLRHFMFYAESHGCLEVLAESVEHGGIPPLPPDPDL